MVQSSWLGVLSDRRVVGSGFLVLLAEGRRAEEEGMRLLFDDGRDSSGQQLKLHGLDAVTVERAVEVESLVPTCRWCK